MAAELENGLARVGLTEGEAPERGSGAVIGDGPVTQRRDTALLARAVKAGWLDHWGPEKRHAVADRLFLDATTSPTVRERATAARALAVLDAVDVRREKQATEESKDARRANVDALKALLASEALRKALAEADTQAPGPGQPPQPDSTP